MRSGVKRRMKRAGEAVMNDSEIVYGGATFDE